MLKRICVDTFYIWLKALSQNHTIYNDFSLFQICFKKLEINKYPSIIPPAQYTW